MPNPSVWDREWVRIQQELRDSPGVEVLRETRGPLVDDEIGDDVVLDPSLYARSVRFREVGTQWQTVEPYPSLSGEFFLNPLHRAVRAEAPGFEPMQDDDTEAERVARQLCVIDDGPHTGAGSYTAIRLQPGVRDPQVWFDDHTRGLWRMDTDYRTYVDLLRLTKGAFGWQHLFTRAPLKEWDFESTAARITRMLDALPRLFPHHDYTPLLERADTRL